MEEEAILKVWEHNDLTGYVFISTGLRNVGEKKCIQGTWKDQAFKWPEQKNEIVPYIMEQDEQGKDVYWAPHIFEQPRRLAEFALPVKCMHSDLDEALPPTDYPPTMLWESSPERYAAIWLLDDYLPVKEFEDLNRDFNYKMGADKNCWTVTKVLRIPGCTNHKYETLPKVKLKHHTNKEYSRLDFDISPEPAIHDDMDDILISQSIFQLVKKYSDVLSKDMILKLTMTDSDVSTEFQDRSGVLFALEHELYKTGIPIPDLIELLRNSGLNKFSGRKDEAKCWEREFEKVKENVGKVQPVELQRTKPKPEVLSLVERMARRLEPPGWLIEGFWPVGSHGIIAGPPKSYKSILVMEMAISVASGTALFGVYPVHHRGTVLYIQNENPEWSVDDRIRKMLSFKGIETIVDAVEIDGKIEFVEIPIPFYSSDYNLNLNDEDDKAWLEETVKQYKPKMLILDSLYMMMNGVDENSMKEVAPMMNWLLHSITKKYGTAVVVLHHWNKNTKGNRDTRMLGSQAFRAWVDSQINAQTDESEEHMVTFYREFPRSYGTLPPVKIKFEMGEPGNDLYIPHIQETEVKVKGLQNTDVRNDVIERLQESPKTLTELSKGLDKKLVSQEVSYLKAKGYLTMKDKKYVYLGGLDED